MEPPGPSEDAHAGKGPGLSTKRIRLELVDKMPDNPKTLVFESTQQRYEIPLRQDEGLPSSHGTTSASAPRNRDARRSPSKHPAVAPTSQDHSQRRTHAAQRTVDRVPCNLKRVVFESTQERFEHQIRREHVLPFEAGHDSDDDFMPFSNARSSTHIYKSKDVGLRKSRQSRAGLSTGECTEARQRKKRATSRSTIVNVRCNPADVIATAQLLNHDQFTAIEADGFGHFLRLKIDAIENKNLLSWLLDHTDPNSMQINIGQGKVLPITPWIISIVLGLPIGGENLKMYSRKEGVTLRQRLIRDLNQNLTEDCNIHISNLQHEILNGSVNPLMKRCFFMILCNRLLLPSSSNFIGSLDIKKTMDHELFSVVDWSQLVFNDLQLAVRAWHDRDKTQLTQTIYGCAIFLILYYLDNIDHRLSPLDRASTPRITFYDNDLIQCLTDADTIITNHGALTFGFQPFKRWDMTCYATADVRGVPLQHTNLSMPGMAHFDIPRLKDLLSQPIDGLTGLRKERVQGFFAQFDDTLFQNTRSIEQSLGNIVRAQAKLAEQFRPILHPLSASQSQFDDTLSQNTRSIEQSLGNIVRAPAKLAEQFRPILHTLSSSQSRDNNFPGDTSRSMHTRSDHDTRESVHRTPPSFPGHEIYSHASFVSAGTLLRSQIDDQAPVRNTPVTGPFGSPVHCVVSPDHISEQLPGPSTAPMRTSSEDVSASRFNYSPLFASTMDQSGHRQSSSPVNSHIDVSPSKPELVQKDPPLNTGRVSHPQGFTTVEANPASSASHHFSREHNSPYGPNAPKLLGEGSHKTTREHTTSVFNWPILDHIPMFKFPGKRLTKKPSKFYSPFKPGIMSRPSPNLESSLRMHDFLCADESSLKSKTLMHFGRNSLTGHDIALSFGVGKFIHSLFMDGFVKCMAEDDLLVRPECHGYRIFLQPLVSDILKSESFSYDKSHPQCSPDSVVEAIKRCLPTTDLKKAKLIFLPVLHLHHWSVYCINLGQARVDVLDSMDYSSNTEATWDSHHSPMGQTLMQRLRVALSLAAPRTFPQFANWRRVPIHVPLQKDLNDSAIFSMKFIEFYDGEGHGSLQTTIDPDRSRELRAELLHYLAFHTANKVYAPPELLQFRIGESHPSFHPLFY